MGSYKQEMEREINENKQDAAIAEVELQNEKYNFIEEIKNGLGEEIRKYNIYQVQPIKYKKPFKMRFKSFIDKIKYVIFGDKDGTETYL